ncbi:hypothetical protein LB557_01860 [Mesorhizobium sp. BR115XR7A]|uniref:hypothetical protein n=1 Tax=Mesorhizobium sp. BR115XR7A TaxID=2876645 RepID=UPI001CCE0DED|nr:hypothetical protein [Mesorhizobium sp. BR115XR7A]MBZ9934028.1 hypothetical protein [Mesorhizobium sp. BR1-1-5]
MRRVGKPCLIASMASSRFSITAPSPGNSDSRSPNASINAVSAGVRCGCVCIFISFAPSFGTK